MASRPPVTLVAIDNGRYQAFDVAPTTLLPASRQAAKLPWRRRCPGDDPAYPRREGRKHFIVEGDVPRGRGAVAAAATSAAGSRQGWDRRR